MCSQTLLNAQRSRLVYFHLLSYDLNGFSIANKSSLDYCVKNLNSVLHMFKQQILVMH